MHTTYEKPTLSIASFSSWVTWTMDEPGGAPSSSSAPSNKACKNPLGSALIDLRSSGFDCPNCWSKGWSKAGFDCTNWRICWKWGVFLKPEKSGFPPADCCCCCCCWACCWAAANKLNGAPKLFLSNVSEFIYISRYTKFTFYLRHFLK